MLAREPVAEKVPARPHALVSSSAEGRRHAKSAEAYYTSALMSSPFLKVITRKDMSDPTLSGIFDDLNTIRYPIDEISLVTHGSGTRELSFPLNSSDKNEKATTEDLQQARRQAALSPRRQYLHAEEPPGVRGRPGAVHQVHVFSPKEI